MKKTLYNLSQSVLFLVLEYIGNLMEEHLAVLSVYKAKYKAAFIADFRADLQIAIDLPDAIVSYNPVKEDRKELIKIKEDLLRQFGRLKGYVVDAYTDPETIKSMYVSAGQQHYEKAYVSNWASVKALSAKALKFIKENEAVLMAKENMPADFKDRFEKIKTDFDTAHKNWNSKDVGTYDTTDAKIDACNAIYSRATAILADLVIVFDENPTLAKRFTITAITAQMKGTTAAGVGGKVTIMGTKTVLNNASVTLVELNKSVKTNTDGRFELSPVASGEYTLRIEAEGYKTITMEAYEIKIGTIGRLNVEMEAGLLTN